jgi:creatinine amidohydrolase
MFLKHMRPDQVRDAINQNVPLLVPAGCVECHGSHAALGLDTIAAEELCAAVSARVPAVVAPSVNYGPTGWAVSGPELGTVDVDGNHFYLYVNDVLRSFLLMGWPRIYVIIHHQGMEGPEALAFRKAAADLAFEMTRAEKGLGWWGYQPPETHGRVWGRVQVMPTILPEAEAVCRGDHAGHFETSLLMHLHPEMVDLSQLARQSFWYTDQPDNLARTSTAEDGRRYFEAMVNAWVKVV